MQSARPSVELFVRSLSPSGATHRQEAILDRLDRLDEQDVIEDYTVTVWGERIGPDSLAAETDTGQRTLNSVAEFESWADANGVSVERFYPVETVDSTLAGDRYTAISLPVMAMAEFVDGELCHVTPHEDDRVRTVADRLDTFED
jgi:hypothetical protein